MYQQNFELNEIEQIFTDEISAVGGCITDRHALPSHLLLRSVLLRKAEVSPGDVIKAGIALKANETHLQITPYVFRRICGNGMIHEQHLQSRHFQVQQVFEQRTQFIDLIRQCAAEQVFRETISQMQQARRDRMRLPRARRLLTELGLGDESPQRRERLPETDLLEILIRFVRERDYSRYGLLNAVTSLARDTQDHAKRWQLEALGGAIATFRPPRGDRFRMSQKDHESPIPFDGSWLRMQPSQEPEVDVPCNATCRSPSLQYSKRFSEAAAPRSLRLTEGRAWPVASDDQQTGAGPAPV